MRNYLKVKAMSLAAEAKIIRHQERKRAKQMVHAQKCAEFVDDEYERVAKYHDRVRTGMYLHRIGIVREEARATNIAYGFLKNKKYSDIERFTYSVPDWEKVERLVMTFAERDNPKYNRDVEEVFADWKEDAKEHIFSTHTDDSDDEDENVDEDVQTLKEEDDEKELARLTKFIRDYY